MTKSRLHEGLTRNFAGSSIGKHNKYVQGGAGVDQGGAHKPIISVQRLGDEANSP